MAAISDDELTVAGCLVPRLTDARNGTAVDAAWKEDDAIDDPELAVPAAVPAQMRVEARGAVAGTDAESRVRRRRLLTAVSPGRDVGGGAVPDEPDGEDGVIVGAAVVIPRRTR